VLRLIVIWLPAFFPGKTLVPRREAAFPAFRRRCGRHLSRFRPHL